MMSEDDFWNEVIHTDSEKIKGKFFIEHRGLDAHIYVLDYLKSMTSDDITYSMIATTMRYDKRIRRIIYKYISFLEEYIRAYISNKYREAVNSLNLTKRMEKLYKEYDDLFKALEETMFSELKDQVLNLTGDDLKNLFSCPFDKSNFTAIVTLRNEVSHNRFLLNNIRLKKIDNKNVSLRANILNLLNYLPKELKNRFISDIAEAARPSTESKDYQSDWYLLEEVVVKL